MADLSTNYLGIKLKNPIVAGSCGLTDNLESLKNLEKFGASAIVLKSLFEEEIMQEVSTNLTKMSSESYMYPETLDYYEYLDAPKESPDEYLQLISDAKKELHIPLIASINCISAGQWTYFPRRIEAAGADALELNLFVMPSDFKRTSAENEKIYFDIIHEVRKVTKLPISVKVSYYFSNLGTMLKKISESNVQGLVLFNRLFSPDIDIENIDITSGYVLSSPTDLGISLRWIAIMAQRVNCSLAASTGIHDGKAVIKQLLAGADVVQVASVLYKHGPVAIASMLKDIQDWMDRKEFKTIADFKGKLSQAQSKNAAVFERVQFMKYFREMKPEKN